MKILLLKFIYYLLRTISRLDFIKKNQFPLRGFYNGSSELYRSGRCNYFKLDSKHEIILDKSINLNPENNLFISPETFVVSIKNGR
ncbi:MAG: hypothetical protein ACRENO_04515, partial [Thermodesulfobacteriota bacterium]